MFITRPSWQRDTDTNVKQYVTDPLASIYNEGLWRLNKVSPLYNLQYSTVKLKQYASKIRQALVSAVAANSSIKYVVKLEEQDRLKYSEEDASGLIINVSSSSHDKDGKSKAAYSAILMSWGVSCSVDNASHLPYMLERGEQRIGTAVKDTLQTIFDCNIKQFSFTQQQLLQIGFSFVENDSCKGTDPFTMTYRTPQVDHKDKLSLSFQVEDIQIIWNGITDEVTNKSDLVTVAYKILQNQIFYMIMVDITIFDLCEVSLPRAEIKNNGIVKMKTPEIINCLFTALNEISEIHSQKDLSSASDGSSRNRSDVSMNNASDNSV